MLDRSDAHEQGGRGRGGGGGRCETPRDARSRLDAATVTIGKHVFACATPRTTPPAPLVVDVCLVSALTYVAADGSERPLDESVRLLSDSGGDVASTLPPKQPRYVLGASSCRPTPPAFFPWERRARRDGAVCGPLNLDRPGARHGQHEPGAPVASRWCRQPTDPSLVRLDRPPHVAELRMTLLRATRVTASVYQ